MRARPFKQDTGTAHPTPVTNEIVEEALKRQAAKRGAKAPPKLMPVTPALPKVKKPFGRKKRKGPGPIR